MNFGGDLGIHLIHFEGDPESAEGISLKFGPHIWILIIFKNLLGDSLIDGAPPQNFIQNVHQFMSSH